MRQYDRFINAIQGNAQGDIPVALWVNSPFLLDFTNASAKEYYLNSRAKLDAYLAFQKEFPDIIIAQGIHADFGAVVEPSAWGESVIWMEEGAPHVEPGIKKYEDILSLSTLDPSNVEMMDRVMKEYKFLWDNLDRTYIEEYGYLRNMAYALGPLETAGLAMGYEKFFMGMYDRPELIHKLLEIITEGIIEWCKLQSTVNGKLERVYLPDHLPTQLSPELFREFGLPYLKQITDEFSNCLIFWHNEGRVNHIIDELKELKIDVYHFGHDLELLKQEMGEKTCLMGNVPPLGALLNGCSADVETESLIILETAAGDGKFLLSTGGGLAPSTPRDNLRALVHATEKFQPNP